MKKSWNIVGWILFGPFILIGELLARASRAFKPNAFDELVLAKVEEAQAQRAFPAAPPPQEEPISEGDVVRTDDGCLYSVLGVDSDGIAWCRAMNRLEGIGTAFQPRTDVFRFRADLGLRARLPGVKHSFGEVPS